MVVFDLWCYCFVVLLFLVVFLFSTLGLLQAADQAPERQQSEPKKRQK